MGDRGIPFLADGAPPHWADKAPPHRGAQLLHPNLEARPISNQLKSQTAFEPSEMQPGHLQGTSMVTDKMKNDSPSTAMLYDYKASMPRIFPHMCSLCNIFTRDLKDWTDHQNNALHLTKCGQFRERYPQLFKDGPGELRKETREANVSQSSKAYVESLAFRSRSRSPGVRREIENVENLDPLKFLGLDDYIPKTERELSQKYSARSRSKSPRLYRSEKAHGSPEGHSSSTSRQVVCISRSSPVRSRSPLSLSRDRNQRDRIRARGSPIRSSEGSFMSPRRRRRSRSRQKSSRSRTRSPRLPYARRSPTPRSRKRSRSKSRSKSRSHRRSVSPQRSSKSASTSRSRRDERRDSPLKKRGKYPEKKTSRDRSAIRRSSSISSTSKKPSSSSTSSGKNVSSSSKPHPDSSSSSTNDKSKDQRKSATGDSSKSETGKESTKYGNEKLTSKPGASSTSSKPGASSTSSKPGASSISSKPGASSISSKPGTSSISSKPGASSTSSKPGASSTSSKPGASGTSSKPGASGTSSKPGAGGTSSKPGADGTSSKPGAGGTSSKPGAGGTSSKPGASDTLSKPGASDTLSKPGASGTSSEPGASDALSKPGAGDALSKPGTSDVLSKPGTEKAPAGSIADSTSLKADIGKPLLNLATDSATTVPSTASVQSQKADGANNLLEMFIVVSETESDYDSDCACEAPDSPNEPSKACVFLELPESNSTSLDMPESNSTSLDMPESNSTSLEIPGTVSGPSKDVVCSTECSESYTDEPPGKIEMCSKPSTGATKGEDSASEKKSTDETRLWLESKENGKKVIQLSGLPKGYNKDDVANAGAKLGVVCDMLIVPNENKAYLEMESEAVAVAALEKSKTMPVLIKKKLVTLSWCEPVQDEDSSENTGSFLRSFPLDKFQDFIARKHK